MKKLSILGVIVLMYITILGASEAHATVGGPTYVYNLRIPYASPVKEIMYVGHSLSGKGCPPEVFVMNVETREKRTLVDCNSQIDEAGMQKAFSAFPVALKRLHLPYNAMKAETYVVRFVENKEDPFEFQQADFETKIYQDVYQNGPREIATLTYSGCYPKQPHIIEGYVTPQGYLVAFVVSTIGGCFEGGYISERIFPVKATMRVYDDPITVEPRIASEPALVDADTESGNLISYAEFSSAETSPTTPPVAATSLTPATSQDNDRYVYYTIIGLLVLLIIVTILNRKK